MTALLRGRLLVCACVLVLVAVIYAAYAKRAPLVEGYRVEAVVATSSQLKEGAPVRVAGVEVGEVVQMRGGPGNAATLTLELSTAGRPIHTDASIRIRSRLFLEGGYYVELRPGSASAPELRDGATIPRARTAVPVSFSQVLSALDADVRRGLTASLRELAGAMDEGGARGLARSAAPLGDVARDGAVVARAARGRGGRDAQTLIRSTARIARAAASRRTQLQRLVAGLRTTASVLARRGDALQRSIRELDATLAVTPAALTEVGRALPPTRRFARTLRPSLRRAPRLLDDLNAGLVQARGLLARDELPRLVDQLDPAVRRLPRLVPELTQALALVPRVTDCLERQVLPVLTAKLSDGKHTTGQPVWLELAHALTSFAGGVSGFDGNGHHGRVVAGIGEQTLNLGDGLTAATTLIGKGVSGRVGSRPTPLPPGTQTPLRPDAECREQRPVDLTARTGGPTSPAGPKLAPRRAQRAVDVTRVLRDARRALQARARR